MLMEEEREVRFMCEGSFPVARHLDLLWTEVILGFLSLYSSVF